MASKQNKDRSSLLVGLSALFIVGVILAPALYFAAKSQMKIHDMREKEIEVVSKLPAIERTYYLDSHGNLSNEQYMKVLIGPNKE